MTVKGFKSGLNELLSGKIYDYRTKKYRNPVKNRNDALCAKFIKLSKVYTTDVVVEEHEIAQSRSEASNQQDSNRQPEISPYGKDKDNGFMNIPDGIDDELPFN